MKKEYISFKNRLFLFGSNKELKNKFFTIFFIYLLTFNMLSPATAQNSKPKVYSSTNIQTNLLEAFVSQGCSSCPPAEDWINALKESPLLWKDIVPVVFHVDYWDRLGWKDVFASHEYTERQYLYGKKGFIRSIYTPGFVLNGKEWNEWFKKKTFPNGNDITGVLKAEIISGRLNVTYSEMKKGIILNVAVLGSGLKTDVTSGENKGRKLDEDFVVLFFRSYPSQKGRWSIALPEKFPHKSKRCAVALWVNEKRDPTPLQATGGWLP